MRGTSLSSQRINKKHVEFQEKLKQEQEEKLREEAKNKTDKEIIQQGKADLEKANKALEARRAQIEQEGIAINSKNEALSNAQKAVLKSIEKGIVDREELKKIFKEESSKKASEDQLPVHFKAPGGRKFTFPFHLIQTWQVSLNI